MTLAIPSGVKNSVKINVSRIGIKEFLHFTQKFEKFNYLNVAFISYKLPMCN